jgi:hypothetical protein
MRGRENEPVTLETRKSNLFYLTVLFGACIGVFSELEYLGTNTGYRWVWVAGLGVVGAPLGVAGGLYRQLLHDMRDKKSN